MDPYKKLSVDEILRKHSSKINNQIENTEVEERNYSREYTIFKQEMSPEYSKYERWCNTVGNSLKVKPSKKDEIRVRREIQIAHLDVTPEQVTALSFLAFLLPFLIGLIASISVMLIKGGGLGSFPGLFLFLSFIFSIAFFYFMNKYPLRLASKWRLKASSQMVPAILYVVVYMRHTPNLEKAIAFASKHLQYPLALDFKKVFYDVAVGKFSSIKESLDNYLQTWEDYSTEFIEAFHLIESSLFEPEKARRISTLEKALQVVLDGVYDKMLKFTHSVRSPLTNVYMLGVVLPTLALALLPLASAMLGGMINAYHVFVLFNLIIPFFVFYLTDKIMFLRPGGYGETTLLERNPLYPQYKSKKPYVSAFFLCLPFFILGLLPLIFQFTPLPDLVGLQKDYTFSELGLTFFGGEKLFGFEEGNTGPFGIGALILGMFFPLGIALFFSLAYEGKTSELIKERKKTKQLENEFNNSLFQLGNRLGNGIPAELVFGKVAESSKGLMTEDFFRKVNYNIRQMGMGVEKAIFDSRRGAIRYYPSDLIATSMKVLIESSKKGLKIAALSLMSISEYVKNIKKITDRLKDLLAEIVSDMRSNMTFLAPLLSGIVVGLSVMITSILSKLTFGDLGATDSTFLPNLGGFFEILNMIPPYYLQMAIGIYLIQVIFILTKTLVTIDSGEDKLQKTNKVGKNLKKGILLYFIVSLIATLGLFVLTTVVLGGMM